MADAEWTDEEIKAIAEAVDEDDGTGYVYATVAATKRIVAARVQALTAERDELVLATQTTVELETVRWERDSALGDKERAESEWDDWKSAAESYEADRDAARAELAAANARVRKATAENKAWRAEVVALHEDCDQRARDPERDEESRKVWSQVASWAFIQINADPAALGEDA